MIKSEVSSSVEELVEVIICFDHNKSRLHVVISRIVTKKIVQKYVHRRKNGIIIIYFQSRIREERVKYERTENRWTK